MKQAKLIILLGLILMGLLSSCSEGDTKMMMDLNGEWEFRAVQNNEWRSAEVPGTVHTDLLELGDIQNPYYRLNDQEMQWIGETDWEYRKSFTATQELLDQENIELCFDGLDTYATVLFNGDTVLSANNMHRRWRVDIKPLIRTGDNDLIVHFKNVFDTDMPKYEAAAYKLMSYDNNDQADIKLNMYARKAGFTYGWDWGPRLITSGIWRPVFLEAWTGPRIASTRIDQNTLSAEMAEIEVVIDVTSSIATDAEVTVTIDKTGQTLNFSRALLAGKQQLRFPLEIDNPQLWWTHDLGDQALYTFDVVLNTEIATTSSSARTGLRAIEIRRDADEWGRSMEVVLNGIPVFMKGANYIPQDNFLPRVTEDRFRELIGSAKDVGMNMLRVWGGGVYQEDIFYDLCDEEGLLIWQDYMFACAMYPDDEAFLENVQAEVLDNTERLYNHPSIALWCGNNEVEISWYAWGWRGLYDEETQAKYEPTMLHLFRELIPQTKAMIDSTRYYHATSPNAGYGDSPYQNGDAHYWGVWHNHHPFENYREHVGRFNSEFGFQSYPSAQTVAQFTKSEDHSVHSPVMLNHQRCWTDGREDKEYSNRLISMYMDRHFRAPKSFEDTLYVSQLLQAKGVGEAVDIHRRMKPYSMATLFWQINDIWPVTSWSSIDYYGRWKALHYGLKTAYAPTLISFEGHKDSSVDVHIVSDRLEPAEGTLYVDLVNFSGEVLKSWKQPLSLVSNSPGMKVITLSVDDLSDEAGRRSSLLQAHFVDSTDKTLAKRNHFMLSPKELELEAPSIEVSSKKQGEHHRITLITNRLAKSVYLTLEGQPDVKWSDNFFDLIPGQSLDIELSGATGDPESILDIMSLVDTY